MKKIIILGNGFDLAHDLKTSYKDFIKYIFESSINYNKEIRNDLIDVGGLLNEYQSYDFIKSELENILKFKNKYGYIKFNNIFFKQLISRYFETDWLNIEEHYFHVLNSTSSEGIELLQFEFEVIKKHLENFLTSEIKSNNIKLIPEFFNIFLDNNPNQLIFLNFNYTLTVNKYIEDLNLGNKLKILNVHGELNSNDNRIIFGYGDDTNPKYTELINKNNNLYLNNLKRQLYNFSSVYSQIDSIINVHDTIDIYIIGHSLGLTDKTLLKEILENQYVRDIKLFYYKDRNGFGELNNNIRRIVNDQTFKKVLNFTKCSSIPQLDKE